MQLRIDRAKGRNAYADNVVSEIPVDFSEESRAENLSQTIQLARAKCREVKLYGI